MGKIGIPKFRKTLKGICVFVRNDVQHSAKFASKLQASLCGRYFILRQRFVGHTILPAKEQCHNRSSRTSIFKDKVILEIVWTASRTGVDIGEAKSRDMGASWITCCFSGSGIFLRWLFLF